MTTTELTAIHADTDDRYEFTLLVDEVLPVRVVVSTVFGDHYGAHAVVETGEEYAPEDAYLYNGDLMELPSYAVASIAVPAEKAAFRRHRILKTLASAVEGRIQAMDLDAPVLAEALSLLKDEDVPAYPDFSVATDAQVYAAVTEAEEAEYAAQAEAEIALDAIADRAFAEDLERRSERAVARDEALCGPSEPIW